MGLFGIAKALGEGGKHSKFYQVCPTIKRYDPVVP